MTQKNPNWQKQPQTTGQAPQPELMDAGQKNTFEVLKKSKFAEEMGKLRINMADQFMIRLNISLEKLGAGTKNPLLHAVGAQWAGKLVDLAALESAVIKGKVPAPKVTPDGPDLNAEAAIEKGIKTELKAIDAVAYLNTMPQENVDRFAKMAAKIDDPRIVPVTYTYKYVKGMIPAK